MNRQISVCLLFIGMSLAGCGTGLNPGESAYISGATASPAPASAGAGPSVASLGPVGTGVSTMTFTFDMAMDITSVSASDFTVFTTNGATTTANAVQSLTSWNAGKTGVTFQLQSALPAGGTLHLSIAAGSVKSAAGATNLDIDLSIPY